jgi:D-erythro-7,8-dihydroneopterin triphosphate epimerase
MSTYTPRTEEIAMDYAAAAVERGPSPQATIEIKNLRLRTLIGFNPEELTKRQDVVINILIRYRIGEKVLEDRVEEALNYKTVTKNVIDVVENGQFLLLEKLVADVLDVCSEHPDILYARVTTDKPHALRFADSVSLTLEYDSRSEASLRILEKAS